MFKIVAERVGNAQKLRFARVKFDFLSSKSPRELVP